MALSIFWNLNIYVRLHKNYIINRSRDRTKHVTWLQMLRSNTYTAILNILLSPTFLYKINHPLLQEAWGGNNIHKRNRWENVLSPAECVCGTRHNKESSERWRQKVSSLLAPLNLIATRCHNASTAQTCLRAPSLLSGLEEKHQKNFSYCRSPFCHMYNYMDRFRL